MTEKAIGGKLPTSPLLLKEKAYIAIREGILKEIFKPGQFLTEKQLIEYLDMSKTPIKSALDRLETEGFLVVSPKQGILIKELSLEKVRDLFDLRLALELFVAGRIVGKLNRQQCEQMEQNLAEQRMYLERGDNEQFTFADAEFHVLLCEFSGNREIALIMQNNQAHLHRFALRVINRVPDRLEIAYRDHQRIYEALRGNDAELSSRLIQEHLQYGKGILTQ